jgi:hypothetical protein
MTIWDNLENLGDVMDGRGLSNRYLLILFLSGLALSLAAASFQKAPGYMDADYYYAGALRIAAGQDGEPYLWNYLNDPSEMPGPSFAYWMPLTSFVAAAGIWLLPSAGFWGARLFFILLAALVPVLAALLACRLTADSSRARLAGLLALFPGFYLPYLTTTDSFPIYMVLGAVYLLAAFDQESRWGRSIPLEVRLFALGLLAGLLHLARADGVFWLAGTLLLTTYWNSRARLRLARLALLLASSLVGYALVMAPWLMRNLMEWGSLFPPGGSRAVWITEYDQTMIFPAAQLSIQNWLAAGMGVHLLARWNALAANLQSAVAVQGGIILFPFILAGLWQLRGRPEVRFGAAMWLVTFVVMTLFFPYAGPNGGFFHSGAATQVLFWAAVPVGIVHLMERYAHLRRLPGPQKITRFAVGLALGGMILLSVVLYYQRVIGSQPDEAAWNAGFDHYRQVESVLAVTGVEPGAPVLVNNPPGFWLASGRPAVVIPFGDESMMLAAARQFGICYVVLEVTNPRQLADLYHGRSSYMEFEYFATVGTTQLYQIGPSR